MPFIANITDLGRAKILAALVAGTQVTLTQLAVGDSMTIPTPASTQLGNELHREPLESIVVDPNNEHAIRIRSRIPSDQGGWYIREFGIFDTDDEMIITGAYPETWKPSIADGTAIDMVIDVLATVDSTDTINLAVNPSAVMATLADIPVKASQPEADAGVDDQKYITALKMITVVTTKIADLIDSAPNTLDTLNEIAAALANDPNFATTMLNALAGKEPVFAKNTAFNKNFGAAAGEVCEGNDPRLSDSRVPLIHGSEAHGDTYMLAGWDRDTDWFPEPGDAPYVFNHTLGTQEPQSVLVQMKDANNIPISFYSPFHGYREDHFYSWGFHLAMTDPDNLTLQRFQAGGGKYWIFPHTPPGWAGTTPTHLRILLKR